MGDAALGCHLIETQKEAMLRFCPVPGNLQDSFNKRSTYVEIVRKVMMLVTVNE